MLSWMSGKSSQQQQKAPSSDEGDVHSGSGEDESIAISKSSRRTGTLLPKLRRAFETATISSNSGSFPTAPLVEEETTVFEASGAGAGAPAFDDSHSYCSQSIADMSCATGLSYNMSKIEDESIQEGCDAVFSSPNDASDTDSFFGTAFREMVSFGDFAPEKKETHDDVWLLSSEPNSNNGQQGNQTQASPTGSILQNVPVLVLPASSRSKSNMKWNGEVEEEEIKFGDQSGFPGSTTSASTQGSAADLHGFDDNYHGSLRNRAHMLGNNIKGIWYSKRGGGKDKAITRRNRRSKRRPPSGFSRSQDPLKELSRCHDKMAQNQRPFSPAKALSKKISKRKNRGEFLPDMDGDTGFALDCSASKDEDSVVSGLSTFSCATNALDGGDGQPSATTGDDDDDDVDDDDDDDNNDDGGDNDDIDDHGDHDDHDDHDDRDDPASEDQPDTQEGGESETTEQLYSGFKFKSPKNDTPRIVWGENASEDDEEGEEPRVLYTDEGEIAAIIHPKPRRQDEDGGFPEDPEDSVFHHLFHSELSTLYEESSSLEASTFATLSHSRSSSSGEHHTNTHRGGVPKTSQQRLSVRDAAAAIDASSVSSASTGVSSKGHHCENQPPATSSPRTSADQRKQVLDESREDSGSTRTNGSAKRGSSEVDAEVQMRWEISLRMMENSGQWRQPMALMNTEELSIDYVAEI